MDNQHHHHHDMAGNGGTHHHHHEGHNRQLEAEAEPEPWAGGHEGMMMYFHGGYTEVILFDFWRIDSVGGLVGSMFACFVLGILYEGIKFARDHVLRTSGTFKTQPATPVSPTTGSTTEDGPPASSVGEKREESTPGQLEESLQQVPQDSVRSVETSMFSLGHLLLTSLHLIQVTLAYFLMLIVMTYNTWLCLAVVIGATVGYFLFGWRKNAIVDVSDHCH